MIQKVLVLRGIPASGKSTFARAWVAEDPTNRVRVNKDDLRAMLHGGHHSRGNEKQVIQLEQNIIINSLSLGKSVVVDNTHLATDKNGVNKHLARITDLVKSLDREVSVEIKTFDIDPNEAVKRDLTRANPVGSRVIWRMYANK